jgi:glycosyltransferase involved in cell wall biosynthesis
MGGAELFLYNIASYYINAGFHVIAIFMKTEKTFYWRKLDGIELIFSKVETERNAIFWLSRKIINLSKSRTIKYTFTSHGHLNGLISLLRFFEYKTDFHIARESTFLLERFRGLIGVFFRLNYHFNYQHIDLIIAQTNEMRQALLNSIENAKHWNFHVIENPIDLSNIISLGKEKIEFCRPFIVTAARLKKIKKIDVLIKAFFNKKLFYKYDLFVLGDGEEKKGLEILVKTLNIENFVKFLGHKTNPMPYFREAQACVISSEIEGFPNTLLQMMALNNKVVSTLCTASISLIPNIVTCSINDEHALGEALINSLEIKKDSLNSLNIEYLKNRSISKTIEKIEFLLNEN